MDAGIGLASPPTTAGGPSFQSPGTVASGMDDAGTGLSTPATTAWSSLAPAEGRNGWPTEEDTGVLDQTKATDFDFDEWFWNQVFTNDINYDEHLQSFCLDNSTWDELNGVAPAPSSTESRPFEVAGPGS